MIYLDHNATTPLAPEALEAMLPFLKDGFGNASSVHKLGQRSRKAVEEARRSAAELIGANPDEMLFTSCGSESNSLALFGAAHAAAEKEPSRKHFLVSKIEHDSIREAVAVLQRRGFEPEELGVDAQGRVDPAEVKAKLNDRTFLVSVMLANNEVGTLQPAGEIAALCRERGVLSHTDGVQAAGKVPVDVKGLGVDLLSLAGHKFNGPKGVGALFIRRGVELVPIVTGNHENNRRGGTLNVPGIVGLGVAARLARERLEALGRELRALRDRLEHGVLGSVRGSHVTAWKAERLPNTAHFCFEGLEGQALIIALDLEGICVSGGSACSSGAAEPSHVLAAMGVKPGLAQGAVRFSLGSGSSATDVEAVLKLLPSVVEKLRKAHSLI